MKAWNHYEALNFYAPTASPLLANNFFIVIRYQVTDTGNPRAHLTIIQISKLMRLFEESVFIFGGNWTPAPVLKPDLSEIYLNHKWKHLLKENGNHYFQKPSFIFLYCFRGFWMFLIANFDDNKTSTLLLLTKLSQWEK